MTENIDDITARIIEKNRKKTIEEKELILPKKKFFKIKNKKELKQKITLRYQEIEISVDDYPEFIKFLVKFNIKATKIKIVKDESSDIL